MVPQGWGDKRLTCGLMADNPAVPPIVGGRLETLCPSCRHRGVTVWGIDNERQVAIVQCDRCTKVASVASKSLFGPDEVAD